MLTLILLILAFMLIIFGILGSILPALPGPPLAWVGLLLFFFIKKSGIYADPAGVLWYWGLLGFVGFFEWPVLIRYNSKNAASMARSPFSHCCQVRSPL